MNQSFLERLHAAVPYTNGTPVGAQRVRYICDWDLEPESGAEDRLNYETLIFELLEQFTRGLTNSKGMLKYQLTLRCELDGKHVPHHHRPEERQACFKHFVRFLEDRGYYPYGLYYDSDPRRQSRRVSMQIIVR